MENIDDVARLEKTAPQTTKLITRLKLITAGVWAAVSLAAFTGMFYTWYLIATTGFSWITAVSCLLALVIAINALRMVGRGQ
jgi:hypothetical protein